MRTWSKEMYLAVLCGGAALVLTTALVMPGVTQSTLQFASPTDQVKYGIYDPDGVFAGDTSVRIEHIYIPWRDADLNSLTKADGYARRHGRDLLISVEPWSWSPGATPPADQLLSGILAGAYDGSASAICAASDSLQSPVTIRWAHEMDLHNGRFPWSSWSPQGYVAAYRHFVTECRKQAPRARFMWSPRGEDGLAAYYPGDGYVDEIGLTVLDLQQYDMDRYGHARSFEEALRPAYDRVAGYGKPIVVAELGFSGDQAFTEKWSHDTRIIGDKFPKLVAVIYFNEVDPFAWPAPYGRPDWRLQRGLVN
ncbi:glycoside hydrolase family 26 protein [Ancylobacter defluvii]|uniref:Beta-mannanase n=1 Tax=Ancylobacter defluvii TaxID=1282440 RepID=A0A9W6NCM7_9HYPH|nr:beta-mannosidase [Ancylobacter defluvii]MBS7586525.1 beta-mannosidase [Ancylobacter defluvii]GLK85812.1 beta-mannanase [Ancylobacter defluvii]